MQLAARLVLQGRGEARARLQDDHAGRVAGQEFLDQARHRAVERRVAVAQRLAQLRHAALDGAVRRQRRHQHAIGVHEAVQAEVAGLEEAQEVEDEALVRAAGGGIDERCQLVERRLAGEDRYRADRRDGGDEPAALAHARQVAQRSDDQEGRHRAEQETVEQEGLPLPQALERIAGNRRRDEGDQQDAEGLRVVRLRHERAPDRGGEQQDGEARRRDQPDQGAAPAHGGNEDAAEHEEGEDRGEPADRPAQEDDDLPQLLGQRIASLAHAVELELGSLVDAPDRVAEDGEVAGHRDCRPDDGDADEDRHGLAVGPQRQGEEGRQHPAFVAKARRQGERDAGQRRPEQGAVAPAARQGQHRQRQQQGERRLRADAQAVEDGDGIEGKGNAGGEGAATRAELAQRE
ncbi:MAG: hypothetical protein U1E14_01310 [Geminicoccaceae bacterium]